jgi:hypothetical protein
MADKDTPTRSSNDKDTPTRSSNMEKAEGGRWTSDPDTVEVSERYSEGIGETNENSGGISNRPLEEEVERQDILPDRGTRRTEERGEGDVER